MKVSTAWVLVLVLLGGGSMRAAPGGFGSWNRLETDDFSILSDASPKEVEEFAVTYAAFREVVRKQLVGAEARLPRSTIVLFRREKSFQEYATESKDKKFQITAFSTEVDGTALTALSVAGNRQEAVSTLVVFETVWLLRRSGIWVPIWMAQGAGEVLSTLQVSKGRVIVGKGDIRYTQPLGRSEFMTWPRFFSVTNYSPEYNGEKDPGVYHGQAWALMHWILLSGPNGPDRFAKLALQLKSTPAVPAIEQVMGVPEAGFIKAVRASMRAEDVVVAFDEKAMRAAFRTGAATEVEVRVQLTELLAAAGISYAAEGELARAQLIDPESVQVLEARARQALRKNDKDEAASLYQRAIAVGSKNPQSYLLSARVRLDGSSVGSADYAGGGGNNVGVALGEIRQALALVPGNLEAYEAMGRAFFVAPLVTLDDIAELSRGIGPGRSRVQHYRALLYDRLGKFEESIADLRAVISDPECPQELRKVSEQRLAATQFSGHKNQVEALIKAKKFAEAQALIAAARSEQPGSDDNYARLAKWVAGQEQNAVFATLRRQVEDLVEERRFDEARALLETAGTATKNEGLSRDLVRFRAWFEETAALARLNQLFQSKQWSAYHEQVQEFFRFYPKSSQTAALRQADERAQSMQAAAELPPAKP